jgi:hypothetical protein
MITINKIKTLSDHSPCPAASVSATAVKPSGGLVGVGAIVCGGSFAGRSPTAVFN